MDGLGNLGKDRAGAIHEVNHGARVDREAGAEDKASFVGNREACAVKSQVPCGHHCTQPFERISPVGICSITNLIGGAGSPENGIQEPGAGAEAEQRHRVPAEQVREPSRLVIGHRFFPFSWSEAGWAAIIPLGSMTQEARERRCCRPGRTCE
ncbi:MAG: hypothetical protein JF886_00890 [Candidatus Dormibacteraeota bacterium]|uniref:Uncharacterized protein n=1 Tax=Candidatus Aeolococcus gillhamiae TaxID=3127015 RepID=A0A934JY10_9BACT|nr:hypothetical protein [Candidatus Dormibacteraeota bacterium]